MIIDLKKCCFSGHRPEKLDLSETIVVDLLKKEIIKSVNEGYNTFITGMSRRTDIWAGEIVLDIKKNRSDIRLICAIPYPEFSTGRDAIWKDRFETILHSADDIVYVCSTYQRNCYQIRNEWMVDHSDRLIAVYNGSRGGTYNTIRYARKKQIDTVNVLECV